MGITGQVEPGHAAIKAGEQLLMGKLEEIAAFVRFFVDSRGKISRVSSIRRGPSSQVS
jgi:hypothetical protein